LTISRDLADLIRQITSHIEVPDVRYVHLPDPQPSPDKEAEFGVIGLECGCGGFFYAWLGGAQDRLQQQFKPGQLIGRSPLDLVDLYMSDDEAQRSIGLAAINAISQHLFHIAAYQLETTSDSMAQLAFSPGDHVGMVGLFPSLVKKLRVQNIDLTVIENKPHLVLVNDNYEVTLDVSRLHDCNKILCTGAVLLNDTVDEVLDHCRNADVIAMIGPTVSCLPDPLFARGVYVVGGTTVADITLLMRHLGSNIPFGASVEKYTIRRDDYAGVSALLERAQD